MADYLLDTNVLILQLRGNTKLTQLLTQFSETGELSISVVTRTVVLAGMHPREEQRTMTLLDALISWPLDPAMADWAGRLIYQYARQGIQLSLPDAQIAATALQNNLMLVTTNPKHFPMPELQIYVLRRGDL